MTSSVSLVVQNNDLLDEYVYDTIALYGSEDAELATLKYQKIILGYRQGEAPDGKRAYESIARQLISEVQDYLRVGDAIGFFVFKRPTSSTLSPHLKDRPFAGDILGGNLGHSSKIDVYEAVKEWRARAASEYGSGSRRYFGRKHVWIVKKRTPNFLQTISNPVTADDGHGGVKLDYIDINEPCEEGA